MQCNSLPSYRKGLEKISLQLAYIHSMLTTMLYMHNMRPSGPMIPPGSLRNYSITITNHYEIGSIHTQLCILCISISFYMRQAYLYPSITDIPRCKNVSSTVSRQRTLPSLTSKHGARKSRNITIFSKWSGYIQPFDQQMPAI